MSIRFLLFYTQGTHIVGHYRRKCFLLSLTGLACCNPCQPMRAPTPSVFCSSFFLFFFHRDIGCPFPSPGHALISDGWVHPSQPPPTSVSGCLLTHTKPSLSPQAVPIALSAVAMLSLCFWNELLGISPPHRSSSSPTKPLRALLYRVWATHDHRRP